MMQRCRPNLGFNFPLTICYSIQFCLFSHSHYNPCSHFAGFNLEHHPGSLYNVQPVDLIIALVIVIVEQMSSVRKMEFFM